MAELFKTLSNLAGFLYISAIAIIFIIAGYFFVISVFGWRKRTGKYNYSGPRNSYAIIIAAHNEQSVIQNTIKSIKELEYPEELYEIFVIADNCRDDTAQSAREAGAVVYERKDPIERGKGHALKWMFDLLFQMERKFDAVCILDADNLVAKDFLLQMDKSMAEGYEVVQGYRDMKNPWESWITSSYAITFWLANRLCQLPRKYLGMNCTLTGSGYAVRMDILKKIGWEIETLTEDVEFYFQLCLNNVKIGWAHDAVIYDEQPTTLSQSWKQRKRWMQGHFSCTFIYGRRIFHKFMKEKTLQTFDSLVMLTYPFFYIAGCILMAFQAVYTMFEQIEDVSVRTVFAIALIWTITFITQNIYSLSVLVDEKKANKNLIFGLIILPIFNFTWIPIMIQGYFSRKNKEWAHITHTGSVGGL